MNGLRSFLKAALLCAFATSGLMADDYYKEAPQFHQWPDSKAARYEISRIGPIGIGLSLIQPAFTMRISSVEPGSPADATGQLKKGQLIESINGQTLKDRDPRVILGDWITAAEAKDGVLKMMVKDGPKAVAREVIVQIPALGAYSKTWPVDCAKSDQIIRRFADFLAKIDEPNHGAALFLLSTGEQKDLDVVARWFKGKLSSDRKGIPWDIGYAGLAVCEYYLRTGDQSVLPAIKSMADELKRTIYNGGWAGRGAAPYRYMAGGHLNGAGVHCVTYLMLAKECGVDVDPHTFDSALKHFYRFAGHGNVPYGDGLPEGGFVDNGKTGGLTFAMAAAAALTPEGEKSVYAKARDISGTKGFYSTSWLYHGHTGGGIGELWRGTAMGVVKDKRKEQYRSFMDGRRWMYELARTHDGAFGWPSGWNVSYGQTGHTSGRAWGNYIPLIYTLPLKKLRIYGAPRTPFSNPYTLPERPWGTAADEIFLSLEPGEYAPGKALDISRERLATHASMQLMGIINDAKVSDENLLAYAHHIDQGIRAAAARAINNQGRFHLVVPLLKSKDARGRHAGVTCITGMFKGKGMPTDKITEEMFELVGAMINDPEESWWVVESALNAIGRAQPEFIEKHIDPLGKWLQHEDWWLRRGAMIALTPIATDKKHYREILPVIGKMIASNERAVALQPVGDIVSKLQAADPEVQKFALTVMGDAYLAFPQKLEAPGGQDLSDGVDYLLDDIAESIASTPGGFDVLYDVSKKRSPDEALPHEQIYIKANPENFGPIVREAFLPVLKNSVIPAYVEKEKNYITSQRESEVPGWATEELVKLYQRTGDDTYDWKPFGPDRYAIEWQYHSFDSTDGKLWESGARHRKIEWPEGMDDWYQPGFNASAKGWKQGRAPFGSTAGKFEFKGRCMREFCKCSSPLKTIWEKEVLLMRTEIELPPFKDGHAYRLLVGGRSHVKAGDGTDVWINGKSIASRSGYRDIKAMYTAKFGDPKNAAIPGVGKRQGERPTGLLLTKEIREEMKDGKIVLAVTGFLNFAGGKKANRQSFWFEEMKLPDVAK